MGERTYNRFSIFTIEGIQLLKEQLHNVVRRFPIPIFFVISLTFYSLTKVYDLDWFDNRATWPIFLVCGLLISTVIRLRFENYNQVMPSSVPSSLLLKEGILSLMILGLLALSIFYWVPSDKNGSVWLTLLLCFSLLFSAAYWFVQVDTDSYWYYNFRTVESGLFAALTALILGAGLSVIFVTIWYLFNIEISGKLYGTAWVLSWCLVFPMYVLIQLEKQFVFDRSDCGFPRGVDFIVKFLLAPLMLTYMLILYAYFVKILLTWELPRGNLGWMTSVFGAIGLLTYLISHPLRDKSKGVLKAFQRYFIPALIVPTFMLFLGGVVRILDYGFTQSRYWLLTLGVWLLAVILAKIIKKDKFHIKFILQSFSVLILLSLLPIVGANDVSIASQNARLTKVLTASGYDRNGLPRVADASFDHDAQSRISSIVDYLRKSRKGYESLTGRFSQILERQNREQVDKLYSTKWTSDFKNRYRASSFTKALGFDYLSYWQRKNNNIHRNFHYYRPKTPTTNLVALDGYEYLVEYSYYSYSSNNGSQMQIGNGSLGQIVFDEMVFKLIDMNSREYIFDLKSELGNLVQQFALGRNKNQEVEFEKSFGPGQRIKLVLVDIIGKLDEQSKPNINSANFKVLIQGIPLNR